MRRVALLVLTLVAAACGTTPTEPTDSPTVAEFATATPVVTVTPEPIDFDTLFENAEMLPHDRSWFIDQGGIGIDELLSVLSTSMGATEDLTAVMERLGPIAYDVFTLPDTTVVEVQVSIVRRASADAVVVDRRTQVTFVTSASRDDAALTYATELAAHGLDVEQAIEQIEGVDTSMVSAVGAEAGGVQSSFSIAVADQAQGGAHVALDYLEAGLADLELVAVANEWQRPTIVPEGFIADEFFGRVTTSPGGDHAVSLQSDFVTLDDTANVDDVQAQVRANIENAEFYSLRGFDEQARSFDASLGVVRVAIVFTTPDGPSSQNGSVDISIQHETVVKTPDG